MKFHVHLLTKTLFILMLASFVMPLETVIRFDGSRFPISPDWIYCRVTTDAPQIITIHKGQLAQRLIDANYEGWVEVFCLTNNGRSDRLNFYGNKSDTLYLFHNGLRLGYD